LDYLIQTPHQLGIHLRGLRRARGMTQTVVGNQVRLSQKRLSALELNPGSMTVSQLLALSGALGFDVVLQVRSHAVDRVPGTETTTTAAEPPAEW
jgi:HTH-type transcriptional regulator/antitoxin HipB